MQNTYTYDFSFKTSVNEKTYDFAVNCSAVCWALAVYFFLKDTPFSRWYSFSLLLIAILFPYLLLSKKERLGSQGARLFALEMSKYIIIADFLAKYVAFGFISCVTSLTDKFDKGSSFIDLSPTIAATVLHCIFFWIARHIYWRQGEEERARVSGIIKGEDSK